MKPKGLFHLGATRLGVWVIKHIVSPAEVAHCWPQLVALWPAYQHHFERSGQRSIFILVLAKE